jgi:transposase-like protein
MKAELPETLQDAVVYFSDIDNAHEFLVSMRWPNGVCCPRCDSSDVSFTAKRRVWTCGGCPKRQQFSVKVGTIMEDSPIGLDKWLVGIWLIVSAKNGISSYELHRALGITQKSAWFMGHRIRLALQNGSVEKLKGEVEVDETFIGGLARFMHVDRKKKRGRGTGGVGKAIVVGLLERGGKVKAVHVPSRRRHVVEAEIHQNVEKGSEVFTDALPSYNELTTDFQHQFIDHAEHYVNGKVHTNGMENFWSLLKRGIKGTYISVEPFHLFRYLDEQVFRFNGRKGTDLDRFLAGVGSVAGKRLTYAGLTATLEPS